MCDARHMRRAIELARRGSGWVNPNPQVGCVIVDAAGEVAGEGWHTAFGRPHAEREALADCAARGIDPKGATAYVTLEPCSHHGKTPPCADALVEAQVARVVIGSADPNPLVAGAGASRLLDAGIEVMEGFLRAECDALNAPFFHYITTGRPLVIAKFAMTLDGKIATRTGKSRWITGEAARLRVHEDRARCAAVAVGVGTVLADDPMLNARLVPSEAEGLGVHQPVRVVIDSNLRTPLASKLVQTADSLPVLMVTACEDVAAHAPYVEAGCRVVACERAADGRVSLADALRRLGDEGLDSVIVEGGRTLLDALFDAGLVDRVQAYIAPKVFAGVDDPSDAPVLTAQSVERLGDDYLIEGDLRKRLPGGDELS